MKKVILSIIALLFVAPSAVRANEGMWFLMFLERLNGRDMQKLGLQLTPEEIYSINNHSLKDAIVSFGGFCTGSIISQNGLVLTNHHCGYEAIAEVSTPEHNYLRDGYWAKDYSQEIKPSNLYVRFFVRMDDVTKRMLGVVNDKMSEKEREEALAKEAEKIEKENNAGGKYVVVVRPFFQGNEFYYFVYEDYKDVRFVGTPPENIGKFGGDTDNWEWPRHTGDFSMFRVYTDRAGNAAEYSINNIPLKAKSYLKVNFNGMQEKDFAMIMGYPGRTNRWQSSYWIDQNVNYGYPAWVEGSKRSMDSMKEFMDKDQAVRLLYASDYASTANYWKNRQGMIDALTKHKTAEAKRAAEKKFAKWAKKRKNREEYGQVLPTLEKYFEATNDYVSDRNYLYTGVIRPSMYVKYARSLGNGVKQYINETDSQKKTEILEKIRASYVDFDRIYPLAEKALLANGLSLYVKKAKNIPDEIKQIQRQYNGDFKAYVQSISGESFFTSKASMEQLLKNPTAEAIDKDPMYRLGSLLIEKYLEKTPEMISLENDFAVAFRKYVKGMKESGISPVKYPDANSTLRLTYGTVISLPKDSRNSDVSSNYYTTYKTLLAKYKAGDPEFDLSKRMFDLYEAKDFGRYLDKDGTMHICFLTNNDITGGNSGSPVLNGKGELVGLAFDGNIEAMAGDVIFDHKLQRTICVDIRYVFWVVDKFGGAKNIVDELTIAQ